VLGPQGSARLIEAVRSNPGIAAATLFPDAAGSNHALFYSGARPVSAGELYANLTRTPAGGAPAIAASPSAPTQNDETFMQYASARRIDRQEQEQALIDLVLRGPEQSDDAASLGGSGRSATSSMFSAEMLRVLSDARHQQ
jgi:hypothetical protein